jgi:cysteine desulfurase
MRHFYFDHNATTPVAPEVLRDLTETLVEVCGNASSIHHFGQAAKQRLEKARRELALRIGCEEREIVFTSGGTEADNLAIFGVGRRAIAADCGKKHIVTSAIEHPAVLNACAQLEREGAEVQYVPVSAEGVVRIEDVKKALRQSTTLITIMHANNETGALQPIREIAALARASGAVFHSDGVQMAGRLPVNVRELGVDLYSISGHKFGGPKGIGALFVRKGISLDPMLYGGHHERDRRAGTENVPGASALGRAAAIGADWNQVAALRNRLEQGILDRVGNAAINGSVDHRLPNTTNIRFDGIEGEAIVIALDLRGYAVSSGSACSSGAVEPSHVLLAMGLRPEEARSSVRFSLGPENNQEEVDGLIEAVAASVAHLRRISPALTSAPAVTAHV